MPRQKESDAHVANFKPPAKTFFTVPNTYALRTLGNAIKRAGQGFNCWCWVLVCVGFGRRYLNRNSPLLQRANEAVYPFYILHQTVLIALAYYVLPWPAPVMNPPGTEENGFEICRVNGPSGRSLTYTPSAYVLNCVPGQAYCR